MYPINMPTRYNGFKVVKEDGTIKQYCRKHNGFQKVEEEEATTVEELPAKKDESVKKDL